LWRVFPAFAESTPHLEPKGSGGRAPLNSAPRIGLSYSGGTTEENLPAEQSVACGPCDGILLLVNSKWRTSAPRLIAGILVLALLASASGCTASGHQVLAIGSYDMTEVNQFVSSAAPAARGMALVVVKDGKVIESSGYGKFGPGTVVDVGSASRWLATAAMMTLVDQGTLALDDPVSKYLPEFTGEKAGITIRQLWSYDSGLPATDPSITDRTLTLEECVKRIAAGPMITLPGTTVSDGSVSIQVGARVCEVISGMTWQEFFRVRIAEPLGMDSTSFNLMGFNRNPDVAGGARSTAEDYARFLTMLLQGGVWSGKHILSEQAVAQIEQDQAPASTVAATPFAAIASFLPSTSGARPGLGVWREETDPGTDTLLIASCPGTYGFVPWIDCKLNLAGILSMQYDLGKAAYDIMRVRQLVSQAIAAGLQFKDVPATSWAFTAVTDLSARGLVTGYEDGKFHPDNAVTRAEYAKLVCSALGVKPDIVTSDPFKDVTSAYWAAGYIATAVGKVWLTGYAGGLFKPDEPVSMAQALVVITRSQHWNDTATLPYTDVPSSYWAHAFIQACFTKGIIKNPDPGIESGGKLSPDGHCTRAQACVLVSRLLALKP
jgi:CubicO group peptidase (beta-lactamase class C family)